MTPDRVTRIGELAHKMAKAPDRYTVNVSLGQLKYELDALRLDLEATADGLRKYAHPGCNEAIHKLACDSLRKLGVR